ncbi:hypothetical protein ALC60_00266, partial [Trachymyrmex zeteki]
SGFETVKSRSKVSNQRVFCLSHGPYRIGLAYQLRYHYRLELFSVLRLLPQFESPRPNPPADQRIRRLLVGLTNTWSDRRRKSPSSLLVRGISDVNADSKQEPVIGRSGHIVNLSFYSDIIKFLTAAVMLDLHDSQLKRATSAEKEIAALKEQLAATNDNNSKTEGHQLSQPPQGSDQQQVHDASNPRRTPNSNLEQELQAKDKESLKTIEEGYALYRSNCQLNKVYKAIQVDKSSRGNIEYELPAATRSLFSPGSGQEEPKW